MNARSHKPCTTRNRGQFQFDLPRLRLYNNSRSTITLSFGFKGRDYFLELTKAEVDKLRDELAQIKLEE